MNKEITYKEWVDTYKPILNKNKYGQNYVSVQGEESYGAFDVYDDDDKEMLQNTEYQYIWTLTNEDNHDYLLSGVHYVNRMEYYICAVPFAEGEDITIDMGCCCDSDEGESCEDCTEEEEWKNLQCLKI